MERIPNFVNENTHASFSVSSYSGNTEVKLFSHYKNMHSKEIHHNLYYNLGRKIKGHRLKIILIILLSPEITHLIARFGYAFTEAFFMC